MTATDRLLDHVALLEQANELLRIQGERLDAYDARDDDARMMAEFCIRGEFEGNGHAIDAARRYLAGEPSKVKAERDEAVRLLGELHGDYAEGSSLGDAVRAFLDRVDA